MPFSKNHSISSDRIKIIFKSLWLTLALCFVIPTYLLAFTPELLYFSHFCICCKPTLYCLFICFLLIIYAYLNAQHVISLCLSSNHWTELHCQRGNLFLKRKIKLLLTPHLGWLLQHFLAYAICYLSQQKFHFFKTYTDINQTPKYHVTTYKRKIPKTLGLNIYCL